MLISLKEFEGDYKGKSNIFWIAPKHSLGVYKCWGTFFSGLEIEQISYTGMKTSKSVSAFGELVFYDQSSVGGNFGCFPYLHHPNYNAMPTVS